MAGSISIAIVEQAEGMKSFSGSMDIIFDEIRSRESPTRCSYKYEPFQRKDRDLH